MKLGHYLVPIGRVFRNCLTEIGVEGWRMLLHNSMKLIRQIWQESCPFRSTCENREM